jgi:predicted nucleic acid-binding Zn ribbon protein
MEKLRRKSNQQTLGEVIKDFLRESGWEQRLDEVKIITQWDKTLGPSLAKYTEEVFIKNRVLHIRLNSSTLRQELSYKKTDLLKELNEAVGKEVITDILLK